MAPEVSRRNKTSARPPSGAGFPPSLGSAGRARWATVYLVGVVTLGAITAFWRRRHATTEEIAASVSVGPELADKPAILAGLLADATAKARTPGTRQEGVAALGRLYHANGFPQAAEVCWRVLRSEQPREARWCYYLADLRGAASDNAGMRKLLEETLRLAPAYAPARLRLANLLFKSGELEGAEDNYRLRLKTTPTDPHARLGLARVALHAGRLEEARTLLERLLQDAPHFSTGHNLYAELLALSGDSAGAGKHRWLGRETLRYREPEDPWLDELQEWCHDYDRLCILGTIELQGGRLDQAQAFFARAVRLRPNAPAAYEMLGHLRLQHKDAAGARDLLEQALPAVDQTKSAAIFVTLSLAYRTLGQPAEAVRVARLGLKQAGSLPELLDALGLALRDSGRSEEALRAWETALARSPGDAAINYNMAVSLLNLGRLDDTLAALDRSLALQPTFLPTLLLRGQIELEAGHLDLAEKYLRPAFDAHPEESRARGLLADWHQQMGMSAESKGDTFAAEGHYRDGLNIEENHADLLLRLGMLLIAQSRPAAAIEPLSSYRRLNPESAQGCLFLGQAFARAGQRDQAREILNVGVALAERGGHGEVAQHCREILRQL